MCMLCSQGAVAVSSGVFGASGEPPSNAISCTGNESSILECNNSAISGCQSSHEAGLVCQGVYIYIANAIKFMVVLVTANKVHCKDWRII